MVIVAVAVAAKPFAFHNFGFHIYYTMSLLFVDVSVDVHEN
jgi:hypothetical protein